MKGILIASLLSLAATVSSAQTIDKSEAMQAKRLQMMQELVNRDIFYKIQKPGRVPRVWVAPLFYTLNFDLKQQFVSVVYAYYFDGTEFTGSVRLIDSLTNKAIGSFSSGGLDLD